MNQHIDVYLLIFKLIIHHNLTDLANLKMWGKLFIIDFLHIYIFFFLIAPEDSGRFNMNITIQYITIQYKTFIIIEITPRVLFDCPIFFSNRV